MTRVWITGLGAVSALGLGAEALADALQLGRSGVSAQPGRDEVALKPHAAAPVTPALGADIPPAHRNLHARHRLMALEAAAEAWARARLASHA